MLTSLGRGFRKKARKGGTTAVVVRGNPDGSLKVTESRVLSAGGKPGTGPWFCGAGGVRVSPQCVSGLVSPPVGLLV